jgi:SAM-dependent methyltransferase
MAKLKSSPPRSSGATSGDAFSLYASSYDVEHDANPIARWTRRRNLALLKAAFPAGSRILEIGCGTGAEAIHLARSGVTVVATDAAPGMIAVLRAKLGKGGHAQDVRGMIEPLVLPAGQLSSLAGGDPRGQFDGAYSSFGPLNCEPNLGAVVDDLTQLVRPGGRVVISLLTRYCLWETVWYLVRGDVRRAFRRWGGQAQATVRDSWQDVRIPVYYWSTRAVRRLTVRQFRVERQMALPWLLPPQYLGAAARRFPGAFRALARIDRALASRWPFYAIGDHYLVVLVRRDA